MPTSAYKRLCRTRPRAGKDYDEVKVDIYNTDKKYNFALDLGVCRSTICYAGKCKSVGVWKPKERGVVSEKKETAV